MRARIAGFDRPSRRATGAVALLAALGGGTSGCSIDPLAWSPPVAPPLDGVLAANDALTRAETIELGDAQGPEDVAAEAGGGALLVGVEDGRILRVPLAPDGAPAGAPTTLARTGGRPLGLDVASDGRLLVADAFRGLLAVTPSGAVEPLAEQAGGAPIHFADDVDQAPDGRIYLSDASAERGLGESMASALEARPTGRLLRHDLTTGATDVVLDRLAFANGVAVALDGSYVLVNETMAYRTRRVWLTGPRAGEDDVLVDNLPGFPDGISTSPRGTFWVALYTLRNATLDRLHPHPWAKRVLSILPEAIRPAPVPYALVLELDADGRILRSLHDPTGDTLSFVTSVEEQDGALLLGSLGGSRLGRLPSPRRARPELRGENALERAVIVCDGEVLHGHHLPPTLQTAEGTGTVPQVPLAEAGGTYERDLILDALRSTRGNRAQTFIDSERRIGLVKQVRRAPGEALADFSIFRLVASWWGADALVERFSDPETTSRLLAEISRGQPGDVTGISGYRAIDESGGVQWPHPEGAGDPRDRPRARRLFEDGRFFHPDGRACFVVGAPRPLPYPPDERFPMLLLTGRGSASQWHTETRTRESPVLEELRPHEPFVEIHPDDAARLGVASDAEVVVESPLASVTVRALVTTAIAPGQLFLPMHDVCVNRLVPPHFDPSSHQPAYKSTPVRLRPATRRDSHQGMSRKRPRDAT